MDYSVIGRVYQGGGGPNGAIEFTVQWTLMPSAPNGHQYGEEGQFYVDAALTDTEVSAELRRQVAARVSERSALSIAEADVRGCSI